MGKKKAFEDDSTSKKMITGSALVCSTQLLDSAIEDVQSNKSSLVSSMDSVMRLMKEVECEEKAAEEAKEEAGRCCLDILAKVEELKQAQQLAKEKNFMQAKELCAKKAVFATAMKMLHHCTASLLDDGDRSLAVLDEMRRVLDMRLTSALTKKELAMKEKLEKEASSREALAYQESRMDEVLEESKRLKQEATDISKLQEFLIDRGHLVIMLQEDISEKCRDVNLLRKKLDEDRNGNCVAEISPTPIRKMSQRRHIKKECEFRKYTNSVNEIKKRIVGIKEEMMLNKVNSSRAEFLKNNAMKIWIGEMMLNNRSRECRKYSNSVKEIKKRIVGIKEKLLNKRNSSRAKYLKNKVTKIWIEEILLNKRSRECKKYSNSVKEIKKRIVGIKEEMMLNKRNNFRAKYLKNMATKIWIEEILLNKRSSECGKYSNSVKEIKKRIVGIKEKMILSKRNNFHAKYLKNMATKIWIEEVMLNKRSRECGKYSNSVNGIKKRIEGIKEKLLNKRSRSKTKYLKNKVTKIWIDEVMLNKRSRECGKYSNSVKEIKKRIVGIKEEMMLNKRNNFRAKYLKNMATKIWFEEVMLNKRSRECGKYSNSVNKIKKRIVGVKEGMILNKRNSFRAKYLKNMATKIWFEEVMLNKRSRECGKYSNSVNKIKKRIVGVKEGMILNKRNSFRAKYLKNMATKIWFEEVMLNKRSRECGKYSNSVKEIKKRIVGIKEEMMLNKRNNFRAKNLKNMATKIWIEEIMLNKRKGECRRYKSCMKEIKKRIMGIREEMILNKRNSSRAKYLKNMATKIWIEEVMLKKRRKCMAEMRKRIVGTKEEMMKTMAMQPKIRATAYGMISWSTSCALSILAK